MIAHIDSERNREQSVQAHCRETAALCALYAKSVGAETAGQLQGLLHDAGKMTTAFQQHICQESDIKPDHAFAGAKYLCELAGKSVEPGRQAVARLIAHTILLHHGIHDWLDNDNGNYFAERLQKTEGYTEVLSHMREIASERELLELLERAAEEYHVLQAEMKALARQTSPEKPIQKQSFAFYMGMLERFLQSCLIDADRANTADFMSDSKTEKQHDLPPLWEAMYRRMEEKCKAFSMRTDAISRQRCSISDRCAAFAAHPVGACRLIVPTGGGKTLSSLRFAIESCRAHGKKKILYTAPFMSILEQNSDDIRAIAGEDCFTEHHSNLLAEIETEEELHEYELRTEIWDSPVIATTMVQFLNALFSGKKSCIRRMHRLSEAVIIIDEVQSIPLKCVHLFNLAINFLTHICGTTVVLCSATQPEMEQTEYPLLLDTDSSMTGDTAGDFALFHRTDVTSAVTPYGFSYEEAADFCTEKFTENGNLLLIVNTKAAAKTLFSLMRERCPEAEVIHLSANLCPAHRREKIREMKEALKERKPLICVTTQLIEAGVDISFRCVVRSLAGLDSAAQAAGRCNRNGECETPCPVYLIKLKEEHVSRLEGVQTAQQITQQMLDSPLYQDYLSYQAQRDFFRKLYHENAEKLDYPVKSDTLLNLLSLNRIHFEMARRISKLSLDMRFSVQAFKTAGSMFQVIDSRTQDILVPYNDEAKSLIAELEKDLTPEKYRELLREAQKYTVSVYQIKKLDEQDAVHTTRSGVIALEPRFYDADCGIVMKGAEQEVLLY